MRPHHSADCDHRSANWGRNRAVKTHWLVLLYATLWTLSPCGMWEACPVLVDNKYWTGHSQVVITYPKWHYLLWRKTATAHQGHLSSLRTLAQSPHIQVWGTEVHQPGPGAEPLWYLGQNLQKLENLWQHRLIFMLACRLLQVWIYMPLYSSLYIPLHLNRVAIRTTVWYINVRQDLSSSWDGRPWPQ